MRVQAPSPKERQIALMDAIAPAGVKELRQAPVAPGVAGTLKSKPCCWPIGYPRRSGFHFCNDVGIPGKPYCETHAAIAYVRVTDRREDAA